MLLREDDRDRGRTALDGQLGDPEPPTGLRDGAATRLALIELTAELDAHELVTGQVGTEVRAGLLYEIRDAERDPAIA